MVKLVKSNDPILHKVAEEVGFESLILDYSGLIDEMYNLMLNKNGLGLAANQVGVLKRIIVLNTPQYHGAIINPVITKKWGGCRKAKEGCLSFPFLQIKKSRYRNISVEGYDQDMKSIKRNFRNLSAVVIQHEVDHLNGITIT